LIVIVIISGKGKDEEKKNDKKEMQQCNNAALIPTNSGVVSKHCVRSFVSFFPIGDFSMEGSCCARPPCFACCADVFVGEGRKGMEWG